MKTFPKIDRRVWIALDLQERRRKRMRAAYPAQLPAPVLHPVYPDKLAWDWSLPNPYRWNIWLSWDNGATWVHPDDYWTTGADHDFWPDGGSSLHLVVGVDAAGNEITARSNAVRPDDSLRPAPVLRAAYPDLLQWDWSLANPYKWNVWMSLDNGSSWVLIEDYWMYGDARQFAPDGGSELYYIVGVNNAGVEITEHSNIIRPDDAVPPVPLSVQGLQLWSRVESLSNLADGEPVATWPDESGHETHLAQGTLGSQPVYRVNAIGQPSVQFDGIDDVLASVASVFKPDEHTIFVVARPDSVSENDLIGTGGTGDGDMLLMLYQNRLRGHAWREGEGNVIDGDAWLHPGDLALFEQSVSSSGIGLWVSGMSDGGMGVTGNGANTRKWVKVGSRDTGYNFKGHMLAVLVYDRELTGSEANTVRQYLLDTYAVPTPYPPLSFHTSLAGYWKLDEPEDATRYDSSTNAWNLNEWSFQEATGGGHVPVGQNYGFMNYAADFGDGSGGKGLASFASNNLLDGDFTFSCWLNYNTSSGFDGQGLISLGGTAQIGIRAYDGALNFVIYSTDYPGYAEALTSWGTISENTWTHAVFVKEGNTLRIYINGAEQAYAELPGAIAPAAAGFFGPSDLFIGNNPWGYPLIGLLDEVGCWQRALSGWEVEQLYAYGSGLPFENF